MKPEAKLCRDWGRLLNTIPQVQAHERIENSVCSGTPDYMQTVHGIHSWVEFKVIDVPKNNKIKITHWTPVQREWLARHSSPCVFLLLRIGDIDYLFGSDMFNVIENMSYRKLEQGYHWKLNISDPKNWSNEDKKRLARKLKGKKDL